MFMGVLRPQSFIIFCIIALVHYSSMIMAYQNSLYTWQGLHKHRVESLSGQSMIPPPPRRQFKEKNLTILTRSSLGY